MLAWLLALPLAVAATVAAPPQRIVSLSPSVTEILDGVGAFDRVVAVSTYCEYPEAVKDLPRVGGWTDTNLEQVLALAPDLVILTDAQAPLIEGRLHALGIRTLVVGSQSLDDIFRAVAAIGQAVGNPDEAKRLSDSMRAELDAVAAATSGRPRPSVLVVVDRLPGMLRDIYIATEGSYLTSLVEIAGGTPITPKAPHNYASISAEAIVAYDPEVVFDMVQALISPVAVPGGSKLAENPTAVWRTISIRAVESRRIYPLTDKRLVHPSQFAVRTAREMARLLHPGAPIPDARR
jgi:iron complex transport system substrate-binding protein